MIIILFDENVNVGLDLNIIVKHIIYHDIKFDSSIRNK